MKLEETNDYISYWKHGKGRVLPKPTKQDIKIIISVTVISAAIILFAYLLV